MPWEIEEVNLRGYLSNEEVEREVKGLFLVRDLRRAKYLTREEFRLLTTLLEEEIWVNDLVEYCLVDYPFSNDGQYDRYGKSSLYTADARLKLWLNIKTFYGDMRIKVINWWVRREELRKRSFLTSEEIQIVKEYLVADKNGSNIEECYIPGCKGRLF